MPNFGRACVRLTATMFERKEQLLVSKVYAMQRANGDWFAVDHEGRCRVPLFSDQREASQARSFNSEMLVFKAVMLDQLTVGTLTPARGEVVDFWLVENESTDMKRGRVMNHAQLVTLVASPDE